MSLNRCSSLSFLSWIFFFLNSSVSHAPQCNNCCSNYVEINEPRRSVNSTWQRGQTPLCDRRIRRGWYRFTSFSGTKMPTAPMSDYHCGTHDPIWLNGHHPTVAEGNVVRRACISSFGNTCSNSIYINVTNCNGSYYVYYLKPPYYCAAAYCAGFGMPCPYGKVGEPPHCQDPPNEFSSNNLGDPSITYSPTGEDVNVKLICKVPLLKRIGYLGNVTYEIEWFADGKSIKKEKRCSKDCTAENLNPCPGADYIDFQLNGHTDYKVGQWISCNVSAKYNTNCNNKWSTPKEVLEPFYAGIQMRPSALNLAACDTSLHTITITPTIPIVCKTDRSDVCPKISFHTPPDVEFVKSCEVQLKEKLTPVNITIKAACKAGGGVTQGLKAIIPFISLATSQMWGPNTVLPTIWAV